jgi:hypothetical protein
MRPLVLLVLVVALLVENAVDTLLAAIAGTPPEIVSNGVEKEFGSCLLLGDSYMFLFS